MTSFSWVTPVSWIIGGFCLAISFLRWARVCQREHYLPNSCWRTIRNWLRSRRINYLILNALIISSFFGLVVSRESGIVAFTFAGILAAVFPFWLPVWPKGKTIRWTRRMIVLSLVCIVLMVIVFMIVSAIRPSIATPALLTIFVPLLFECSLRLVAPYEEMHAQKFVRTAEEKLRHISPTVVAVTGSWGKTTTKNHIRDLASSSVAVVMSPASYNNRAGLSRTVNDYLLPGTELLVAEMGMYGPGEIRELCNWVRPEIGVITAIGPMHLERVGSIDGIVAAKSEILEGVRTAVLWVSDPHLSELSLRLHHCNVIRCGLVGHDGLDVEVQATSDGLVIWVRGEMIGKTSAASQLHPANVGCAVGALLAAGLEMHKLGRELEFLRAPAQRASLVRDSRGVTIIDDTYNSNPEGAKSALVLLEKSVSGRKVVVTPGMVELGSMQYEANRAYACEVAARGAELVVVGWTNRRSLLSGVSESSGAVQWFSNRKKALRWISQNLSDGDGVLWENDLPDHYP